MRVDVEARALQTYSYDPVTSGYLPKLFTEATAALWQMRPNASGKVLHGAWLLVCDSTNARRQYLAGHVGRLQPEVETYLSAMATHRAAQLVRHRNLRLVSEIGQSPGSMQGALRLTGMLDVIVSIAGFESYDEPWLIYASFRSHLLGRAEAEELLELLAGAGNGAAREVLAQVRM